MCFVGARYGHFPTFLSHINIDRYTPTPSLVFLVRHSFGIHIINKYDNNIMVFQNILSLLMLFTSDVDMLITYSSFVEAFFTMLSVSSVLWNRWKRPNINRPIKV